jgi:cation diffusion facilitator CzcD-associated flavoprotein CzcO
MTQRPDIRIAVIGAGPVGLIAGRELLREGFTNFTIFDKERAVGGTWHIHSYPGLACDVKAHAYVFTGAGNPDWSASYVEQAEIEAYLQRSAVEFGLEPHLRLQTKITAARYQPSGSWQLETEAGEQESFDFVINAMGNQHTPIFPEIPGRDLFRGESWHSTHWNHDVDLAGKRIALVGSAAAAVQIVPEIAERAAHLYVLQRSPNWVLPRGCKEFKPITRTLFRYVPGVMRGYRKFLDLILNFSHGASQLGHKTMDTVENMGRKHLESHVPEGPLRDALTPTQHFGCQRPLVSDGFYPALMRENVTLVPAAAKQVTESGIESADGQTLDVDVIVYCTGYRVLDFERIEVSGENGRSLAEQMARAPEAFKGIAVPGFPNYFLGVGPNGVLLSASFFAAAESNVGAIVKLLKQKEEAGAKSIVVKDELCREYNDWILSEREKYAWGVDECMSYYHTPTGHTPFLFPGDFKTFKKHRDEAGLHEFRVA